MTEIILYPTETVYALGVNALDESAWSALCDLKQRSTLQPASWLVRDINDIRQYAEVSTAAELIIKKYLPGPLTVVLSAKATVPVWAQSAQGMVSFRISSDTKAQELIAAYMAKHQAPLTCTSANVHGLPPAASVLEIKKQFASAAQKISLSIDGGERFEIASTVVAIENEQLQILRPGPITEAQLRSALG